MSSAEIKIWKADGIIISVARIDTGIKIVVHVIYDADHVDGYRRMLYAKMYYKILFWRFESAVWYHTSLSELLRVRKAQRKVESVAEQYYRYDMA